MMLPSEGHLLRIFVGEADRHAGRALHEWLIEEAHRQGLAGATAIRGIAGYGAGSRIHSARVLRLADDLPMVVEIIDERGKIEAFLETVDHAVREGLATIEPVMVHFYRAGHAS